VLAYGGQSRGICFDGGPHDLVDSPLYGVPIEFAPEGAQAGWRRCARCQELAFNASGIPDGLCAEGGPHDFTGSPAYSLAHEPVPSVEPSPPPPSGPRLVLTESEQSIVVDATGFTAGMAVELKFIVGAATTKAEVVADDQGRFQHTVDQVVQGAAGGLVIAQQEDGAVTTGRLRSFVPAPAGSTPGPRDTPNQ
jgi:hypothetical protein